jgi:RNA polymerase sigma factor (sigma-70 family)
MSAPAPPSECDSGRGDPREFRTTHWSLVLAAGQGTSPGARAALETLCRTYWYPLYAYVRRLGYGPEDAQDLTQSFFVRLLERDFFARAQRERGRFRSFLLTALKHHLGDARDRANAVKRGGGQALLSLNDALAEERFRHEPAEEHNAETIFEKRWVLTLLETVRARLQAEYTIEGWGERFALIEPFLPGESSKLTYAEAAARLGLSEATVRSLVHRLKLRFRDCLRDEIAHTVASPAEIDDEIRHLMAVLSR